MNHIKLHDWLKSKGFALEMRVAAAFRRAGFEVRQSAPFADPETGEQREIDVVALLPDPSEVGFTRVALAIECKSSKNPWVVLSSDCVLEDFNRLMAFAVMSHRCKTACFNRLHEWSEAAPWWPRSNRCGYSLRQAFHDSDVGFSAAMSAFKASQAIATHKSDDACSIVFPVVVVDTDLYECSLAAC